MLTLRCEFLQECGRLAAVIFFYFGWFVFLLRTLIFLSFSSFILSTISAILLRVRFTLSFFELFLLLLHSESPASLFISSVTIFFCLEQNRGSYSVLGLCSLRDSDLFWGYFLFMYILQNCIHKIKNSRLPIMDSQISQNSKSHIPMFGFTSDFFNALSDTVEDNSFDISKELLKSEISNKSEILIEIKIESLNKILKVLENLQLRTSLYQIMMEAERKRRKEAKNDKNIIKILCKISLRIEMKQASFVERAWINIVEFTSKYNMADYEPPAVKKSKKMLECLMLIESRLLNQLKGEAFEKIQSQQKIYEKFEILIQILSDIAKYEQWARFFMTGVKDRNEKMNRAEFVQETLNFLVRNRLRHVYTQILNKGLDNKVHKTGIQNQMGIQPDFKRAETPNDDQNQNQNQNQNQHQHQHQQSLEHFSEESSISVPYTNQKQEIELIADQQKKIDISQMKSLSNYPLEDEITKEFILRKFSKNHYPSKVAALNQDRFSAFESTDIIDLMDEPYQPQFSQKKLVVTHKKIEITKKSMDSPLRFSRKAHSSKKKRNSQIRSQESSDISRASSNPKKSKVSNHYTTMKSYYFPQNPDKPVTPGPQPNKWINQSIKQRLKLVREYTDQEDLNNPYLKQKKQSQASRKSSNNKNNNYYTFSKTKVQKKTSTLSRVTSLHNLVERDYSNASSSDNKMQHQIKFGKKEKKSKQKKPAIKSKQLIKGKESDFKWRSEKKQILSAREYKIGSFKVGSTPRIPKINVEGYKLKNKY